MKAPPWFPFCLFFSWSFDPFLGLKTPEDEELNFLPPSTPQRMYVLKENQGSRVVPVMSQLKWAVP